MLLLNLKMTGTIAVLISATMVLQMTFVGSHYSHHAQKPKQRLCYRYEGTMLLVNIYMCTPYK